MTKLVTTVGGGIAPTNISCPDCGEDNMMRFINEYVCRRDDKHTRITV
jgi:predicted RNA-binding Zn-ribbon protein involved in translation (DUF1610 family)